ncbi:TRANSDUCIN BETA-LIKE 3 [Salix koriyanagi]|uniref:TRANSDUCIN BETA-LIKE 3 n=1 Tax=Salix koriyanagi TaxID=2511006 RepID=A0A9Q0VZ85_9ROSI|nr:TRANSDUCIN BETA-LIKE 3 [Salix koriyanagi]
MSSLQIKKNYRCVPSLQQFYSGGPFVVSSDGSFIACANGDNIKIVDSSNASIKANIEVDTDAGLTALALGPNDKFLFSAGHSRLIRVWDLSTFKCVRSWKGHDGPVMSMACHASGGLLATAGADRKVLVWDVDGGFCTHYFKGHKDVVTNIMFHPDTNKTLLFSGSADATVRVWDLLAKKCIATLERHFSALTSMAVSEDGWTLLTAGRDKVVNLWDLHDYVCKMTVPTYEVLEGLCVVKSGTELASILGSCNQQSGKRKDRSSPIYFVTVGERGTVRIWDSECGVSLYEQKSSDVTVSSDTDDSLRGFTAAVILPLDQGLLCVTVDHHFLFYSLIGHPEEKFQLILSKRLVGYNEEILDMRFLGEEEKFLAVATNLEQVQVYDMESMSCSYVLAGHTEIVLCLDTCVSSSGRPLLVTGSKDNTTRLWNSESRNCIGVGTGHMGGVGAVAFSKRWKNFFVSGSSDRTIKVWSLDGISDDADQPINLKTKAVVAAHDKDINSLAIAPNDSLVCSGSQDRTACVWRLPDLVSVVVLKGHKRGIWSVEFSPVDQCVITASGDKTIKIWAITDGSCLKTFEGHTSSVLRASFLTRGSQFVSCGADGLVKLWTVKTNECTATYDKHEDKVWALAIGKKTEMFATGGGDAVVNLWYDSTASDKEEAFPQRSKYEEGVLRGQELENAVLDADYNKAIQIAFELRRPNKLFELFSELCRKKEGSSQIEKALHVLGKEEIHQLFQYVREWNTKPKLCHVAQYVLFGVFNILPPKEILEIKGIGELLEGLIPYSQRHLSRIDRLVRSTFLLDYTLNGMSVIVPDTNATEMKDAGNKLSVENADQEQELTSEMLKEKTPSKKRKSNKSKDSSRKKVKGAAYTSVAPFSLEV